MPASDREFIEPIFTRRYFETPLWGLSVTVFTDGTDVGRLRLPNNGGLWTVTGPDGQVTIDPDSGRYPFSNRLARTALVCCLEAAGQPVDLDMIFLS